TFSQCQWRVDETYANSGCTPPGQAYLPRVSPNTWRPYLRILGWLDSSLPSRTFQQEFRPPHLFASMRLSNLSQSCAGNGMVEACETALSINSIRLYLMFVQPSHDIASEFSDPCSISFVIDRSFLKKSS